MDTPPAKRKKTTMEHMDIESPHITRSNPHSPIISSPKLPHSRTFHSHSSRISAPHSPLTHTPTISSPLRSPQEREENMEEEESSSSPATRKRKLGGESKHNLLARVKKLLNERLHSIKPVLLAWLQKYLSDQRLGCIFWCYLRNGAIVTFVDYVNKLQFHIDPEGFGMKFPVNVVASPIIPNDQLFLTTSQDLSRPILSDYPGI